MLSTRLETVALMVTKNNIVADIGTDHGYVPIYLIENKISPFVYGVDINQGPLKMAEENIRKKSFHNKVQLIISNGMAGLKNKKVDTAVISGMGGELIVDILTNSPILNQLKELILSPQKAWENVRSFLNNNNWKIIEERIIREAGKFYLIIKAIPDKEEKYSLVELKYGRYLLNKKDKILKSYLDRENEKFLTINNKIDIYSKDFEHIDEILQNNRKAREKYD